MVYFIQKNLKILFLLLLFNISQKGWNQVFENYLPGFQLFFRSVVESKYYNGYWVLQDLNYFNLNDYLYNMDYNGNIYRCLIIDNGSLNEFMNMVVTYDKNLSAAGTTDNEMSFLVKFDSLGNILWSAKYQIQFSKTVNSNMISTDDNGFVLIGRSKFFNSGYIWKFDKDGILQWSKIYRYTSSNTETFSSAFQDNYGNFYIAGADGTGKKYILKLNNDGNLIWSKKIKKGSVDVNFSDCIYDSIHDELFVSTTSSVIKIDSSGVILWDKEYYYFLAGLYTDGNRIFIDSTGLTIANQTYYRGFDLHKFDFQGNPVFSKYYAWNNYDSTNFLKLTLPYKTTDRGFLIFANHQTFMAPPMGYLNRAYVMKLDSEYNAVCHVFPHSIQLKDSNQYTLDTVSYSNIPHITSISRFTLTVSPGPTIVVSPGCTINNKYKYFYTEEELAISPNPNTGKCNITVPDEFSKEENLTLRIFDNSGKLIQEQTVVMYEDIVKVNLEAEAKGIYNVTLSNKKKSYAGKIIFE